MKTLRHRGKTAVKFVTPSGVVAVVASPVSDEMLAALRRKLERKLRRSGHLRKVCKTSRQSDWCEA